MIRSATSLRSIPTIVGCGPTGNTSFPGRLMSAAPHPAAAAPSVSQVWQAIMNTSKTMLGKLSWRCSPKLTRQKVPNLRGDLLRVSLQGEVPGVQETHGGAGNIPLERLGSGR